MKYTSLQNAGWFLIGFGAGNSRPPFIVLGVLVIGIAFVTNIGMRYK